MICPAGLRLNWQREIEKWHIHNRGVAPVLSGKHGLPPAPSTVVSYDLCTAHAGELFRRRYDLAIIDEGHYLKNALAQRTRTVLGTRKIPGLRGLAPRCLVLSGTPVPNRVDEIYPILRRLAPRVIDGMSYKAFLKRYAYATFDGYSERVTGIKNAEELYFRLRSGFMVRRLKADVLKDLPPKRYKMVVFPKSGGFAKILEREARFSAAEILKHGAPVGSALPEIRREMGVAKAPLAIRYIDDLLNDGVKKVVVFAHHREVVKLLERGLKHHGVLKVTGETPAHARQRFVDAFQAPDGPGVFIGNIQAAGVGITLAAASDVVFAEASWVPGENDQAADRCHRIGQVDSVLVHHLVVEGSIDAAILGAAAKKQSNITKILDGRKEVKRENEMSSMSFAEAAAAERGGAY